MYFCISVTVDFNLFLRCAEEEALRQKRLNIRENCRVQLLDRRFTTHLSEMHPTSGLHELCTRFVSGGKNTNLFSRQGKHFFVICRLDWAPPNMTQAFECGPPMDRRYIFKVSILANKLTRQKHV